MIERINEIDIKIKEYNEMIRSLESEKEKIEDEKEVSLKVILKKQRYWKIGNQDFYLVGDKETIHVSCYMGGGGFDITIGVDYDLEKEETYSRSGREESNKEEFEEALKSQVDRISKALMEKTNE